MIPNTIFFYNLIPDLEEGILEIGTHEGNVEEGSYLNDKFRYGKLILSSPMINYHITETISSKRLATIAPTDIDSQWHAFIKQVPITSLPQDISQSLESIGSFPLMFLQCPTYEGGKNIRLAFSSYEEMKAILGQKIDLFGKQYNLIESITKEKKIYKVEDRPSTPLAPP